MSFVVRTYLYNGFACMLLSCHVRVSGWIYSLVCLNFKELLARSRRHIWSLSDINGIRTHDHLVCEQTPNHLSKLVRKLLPDPNKAHNHDKNSIGKSKIYGDSISRPVIIKHVCTHVSFSWNGKKPILFQFITKMIRKLLKTTSCFVFNNFGKILKDYFILKCLTFF